MQYPYPDVQWQNLIPCVRPIDETTTPTLVQLKVVGFGSMTIEASSSEDWGLIHQFVEQASGESYPWRLDGDS